MENESVRLNKYLSGTGLCSRREADKLIEEGRVTVEDAQGGMRATTLGSRVQEGDKVFVDGKPVRDKGEEKLYLMINKPKGIICTGDRRVRDNIIDYAGLNHYISYAGRLDRDSTGLVLLTNDGDLNDKIMRSSGYHEKEYIVKVDRFITEEFLEKMSQGVLIVLDDDRHLDKGGSEDAKGTQVLTRPCVVRQRSSRKFEIVLTQGYNRQIRRMCQALGYTALEIKRVRIMNLQLGGLREGMKRFLTREEIEELRRLADAPGRVPEAKVVSTVRPEAGGVVKDHRAEGIRRAYGEKKSYGGSRGYGEKKSYDEKKPYGEGRGYGEKKPYGGDRGYGEKKPYGEGRGYGEKKPCGGDRGHGEKKPYSNGRGYSGRKPYGGADQGGGHGRRGSGVPRRKEEK